MTREELIKKVALKMDEISSSDDMLVSVAPGDGNPLYAQINNLLNEAVNEVLMKAPIYRLHSHVANAATATATTLSGFKDEKNGDRKTAVFSVPDDFMRLVSISDESFLRTIVELAMEGDDVDKRQHNRHLIAKHAKPVAVIGRGANGRTITCYSYASDKTPNPTLAYIKRYNNDKITTEETGLDDYMIDIVSWVCAGKVFSAQGDINKSKICDENALALMI